MFNQNYKYKSVKTSLKRVINDSRFIDKIDDVVYRAHLLVIQTYQFFKYYILDLYQNNEPIHVIDAEFIKLIFKVLYTNKSKNKKNKGKTKYDDILKKYNI